MESFYTAYVKPINGVPFYFVKHFQTFPEYKDVPPVLENYGMHTNFYKACKIARVEDEAIQKQLLDTVAESNMDMAGDINDAKVININRKSPAYNFRNWHLNLPGLLKLVNLR